MVEEHDRLFARLAEAYGRAWAPRPLIVEADRVEAATDRISEAPPQPKIQADVLLMPVVK